MRWLCALFGHPMHRTVPRGWPYVVSRDEHRSCWCGDIQQRVVFAPRPQYAQKPELFEHPRLGVAELKRGWGHSEIKEGPPRGPHSPRAGQTIQREQP